MERIERRDYLDKLIAFKDKKLIKVITGIRRCGKSTIMEIFRDWLLNNGVSPEQILYLNFEDYDNIELRNPLALHRYIKPLILPDKPTYIFFDEIQHVKDFPDIINSINLKPNVDLYVTGSNAYMLSNEIATLLSGRYVGEERIIAITPEQAANLHVDNPRVWWTYDLGTPELYALNVTVEADGVASDKKDVTFGIRTIESRLTENDYRQFTLNGKDIIIKGAGWTDDIFLRDTPEQLERQVKYVMDMNMNTIRFENIWGKDDTIYDLCDQYGVLALVGWSCQWEWENYCGLPEVEHVGCIIQPKEIDLASRYFEDQVIRLHNHPAVFAWMTGSDCVPVYELEQRYLETFAKYDYRPYISSAKNLKSELTGWSGSKMAGPYEYVGPDYWYLDTKNGGAFGFNTETGGANLPQAESLKKFIPEDQLWPTSKAWDKHCTTSGSAMNTVTVLTNTINGQYGEATSFNDYVRKAHAVDYDATRAMFEAFRVNTPLTTGIVQWMLNSAWPSL